MVTSRAETHEQHEQQETLIQMIKMPSWKKPWHWMVKGHILGCLLTGFLLLLYSYTIVPMTLPPNHCSSPPTSAVNIPKGSCWPKLDIVFMKTHKTASSTLLNILLRFGEKHNLKFAFPSGYNDFNYPSFFKRHLVHNYQPGDCFNIICNHMRFNYSEVHSLVTPNATFITVLRDPAHLFESSFHYFGLTVPFTWKLTGQNKLAKFLQDPTQYYNPQGFNAHYLHNLLFFDLGYNNELDPHNPQVKEHILEVEQRFHLVMLQEYFDESLVLLKDLMCWELEDILYFRLNARKTSAVPQLKGELYQQATNWNQLDALLYHHFNASFWRKVEAFGRKRMAREVASLRRENKRMEKICIKGEHAVGPKEIEKPSLQPWQAMGAKTILGYNLKKNISHRYGQLCRKMVTPDIQYMTELGVNLWVTKLWGYIRNLLQI